MLNAANQYEIEEESALSGFAQQAFRLFLGLAFVSACLVALGHIYGSRMADAGHPASDTLHEIVIGNDVLSVPENMIRFAEQRRSGVTKRLDLYVHWPSRQGYSQSQSQLFNETDPAKTKIVFFSLRPRETVLEMTDRLEPIYNKAVIGNKKTIYGGLTVQQLNPALGYVDEVLTSATAQNTGSAPFVARCHHADPEALLAACETSMFVGRSMEVSVRFPAHMLVDWRTLHNEMRQFLNARMPDAPA